MKNSKQYLKRKFNSLSNLFLQYTLLFIVLMTCNTTIAQTSVLSGFVTDSETGDPIPYVNIIVKNTLTGTTTDTAGVYKLAYPNSNDTLIFSAIGFYPIEKIIPRTYLSSLSVQLMPETFDISEIKITPDEGPMRLLFNNIQKNKAKNNPAQFSKYSYRKYTKWRYQLNNVKDKMINTKAFKHHENVFKTASDSSKYLPLYFSEQLVFNEVQKNPPLQKSTVIADKTNGVGVLNDLEISGYTSALDLEVNYYDNFINLFTQNFVSPIAENGWFYYKYFLADSMQVDSQMIYRVNYQPRRKGENTLKGYFLVEDQCFSIMEIDGDLSITSNINFLKALRLKSNYTFVNDTTPFYQRVQIDALFDYIPFKTGKQDSKRLSLFYTQTADIDQVTINPTAEIKLSNKNAKYETVKLPNAYNRDSLFWQENRLEALTEKDKLATVVIDSITEIKTIKILNNLANMSMTSYYDIGKIELGPYTSFFNTNKVEGYHFFVGARTSEEISKRMLFWGGIGYGTRNKKVNYSLGYGFLFPTSNRQVLKVYYDDKMIRHGENEKILNLYENAFTPTENNLISQLLKHDVLDEIFREQKIATSYEYEWYPGLLNKLSINYTQHESPEFYPFLRNNLPLNSVSAFEVSLDTRWSHEEKLIDHGFLRLYMDTEYPIVHFTVGGGRTFYDHESNYYGKLATTVKQAVNIGQSQLDYAVEAGVFLGKLPYTMLDIPRGNETYGLYRYDFNMLNYLEYVHDKYVHTYIDYHMNGFLIRRLPLLRETGFREVFSSKIMVGRVNNKHQDVVAFPASITTMKNPYIELGAGLENILSMFRIEAIWRVTPKSTIGAPSFGFRALFYIGL
ncbi:DUF5686 family protein [Prolixibacteraceae bacterium Z1-6]|uniref:DUF5686 family protein n=1 Tax=Draconibacterium aestuarii TaxID=2998507 RepID=A0A9X3FGA8_9BACT|nr:DUF5686 family protein [Prolixibacteraceae bacterium Z1-6]